jgi:hypothetical protein
MSLSGEQRILMDIHIQVHTVYDWGITPRTFIIDSLEKIIYSQRSRCFNLIPYHYIKNNDVFWHGLASIVTDEFGWHKMEWGRDVYTWTFGDNLFKIFTKTLVRAGKSELVWYIGKFMDYNSGNDTDEEIIFC